MAPDIHTLTGAYALDALPEAERAQFEEHLEDCDACAQEVRELQATAADLGHLLYEPPPAALRERVLAEIDETRQEAPIPAVSDEVLPLRPRRAPPRSAWMLSSAAAVVAVVVAAGLALQVVGLESRLADMEGVHVEDKAVTLTVHYRRAKDAAAEDVTAVVEDVVDPIEGLKTGSGKMIVEVKPTVEWHKGAIVERLREEVPASWQTVYVGDDTTDEDAFRVLEEGDFGVLVGERSTAADYRVPDQAEVSRLLNWFVGVLDGEMPDGESQG